MKDIHDILFLDIETVPLYPTFGELTDRFQALWTKKAQFIRGADQQSPEELYERAGIYAEFGKIITIAVGYFVPSKDNTSNFRIKAFANHDEKLLLEEFSSLISNHFNSKKIRLCAHNGKEFDFPYIGRRMLINEVPIPEPLNLSGRKPWEVPHIDTMELWKFGDYKHFTSLDLLAALFHVESSKDDIDGSQVYHVYYHENDLERIAKYCKRDVMVLAQVFMRLNQMPLLAKDEITVL
ncbi:3'-5' exonuclease [Roseivirga sp. E12]|uniref:3'-5' exonuclease n=1 Tax=Roseivirga sp. E12 TaxID=2819237 RepID=UPI001ABC2323|nr:3'-5' exonuclease [Roseivirga sp. E12]MBO3699299.1 3'-5' exonuclease [Roseivirga sp. E12]